MATTYYPYSINSGPSNPGQGAGTSITATGTHYMDWNNYKLKFREAGGTGTIDPAVYIQPQMIVHLDKYYSDGTGRVQITVYLSLTRSYAWSSSTATCSIYFKNCSISSSTSDLGGALRTLNNGLPTGTSVGGSTWYSATFNLDPSASVSRTGSFTIYKGSNTASSTLTLSAPTITIKSPVSTSDKITMKFSSGRSDVTLSGTSSFSGYSGLSVQTPTLNKTSVTENGTKNITISFNSNGGTSCDPVTKTVKIQRTLTADNNWAGTGVVIGGTTTISSGTWTASWSAGSWETVSEASVGTLPKPTRTGYKFSGWTWNDSDVVSTTKFSTDATLVAQWTPVEYNIKYNMGTNSKSGFTPLSIDDIYKTYSKDATISAETPTWNDARQLFVNWKGGTSGNTYNVGATIGDAEYFEGATISRKATLTGQWKDNHNTIYLKYYHPSSSSISTDVLQYGYSNITNQQIWKITNPAWTDHSFVGWIKADLVDDTWKNNYNTTKGVYESIDDLETTVSKNLINQYSVSLSNQSLYLPWAHSETYYAIWVKTGKKIKLSSGWKDIQSAYFKGNDNKWHRVTDVWTKTSSGWKHEI